MFSATHQNHSEAYLSHFTHFCFSLCDPPLTKSDLKFYIWSLVLELPKNHFKDLKKSC